MKLKNSQDFLEEVKPAMDLIRYKKQYEGTILGDYITYFLKKRRSPEEEKAMYYGVEAMLRTCEAQDPSSSAGMSVDLNRTFQMLKMRRKGFQDEMRKTEEKWIREDAGFQAEREKLEQDRKELKGIRSGILTEKREGELPAQAEEENEEEKPRFPEDRKIQACEEDRVRCQKLGVLCLVSAAIALFLPVPVLWRLLLPAAFLGIGVWLFTLVKRKREQSEKLRKQRAQKKKKRKKLMGDLDALDEQLRRNRRRIRKLEEKYQEFHSAVQEKQPAEVEIDALTLAIDTISWLETARRIREKRA